MDLAIMLAAISLWGLIQGGMLIYRWNRTPESRDLWWSGIGILIVGFGAGLSGARYFDASFFTTIVAANVAMITGIACMAQAVRAADGKSPAWLEIILPGAVWSLACMSEHFQQSAQQRLVLFSLLCAAPAVLASYSLIRGGLALTGRKVWLTLWIFIVISTLVRGIDTPRVLEGLENRYAASAWHVIYFIMVAASVVGVGYVNLALSDALPRLSTFMDRLQARMSRGRPASGGHPPAAGALWSLRLDRLFMGRALVQEFIAQDIDDLAQALTAAGPGLVEVRRAGVDRLIWVTGQDGGSATQHYQTILDTLTGIAARPTFPRLAMSFGFTALSGSDLLQAAAAADRNAVRIRSRSRSA